MFALTNRITALNCRLAKVSREALKRTRAIHIRTGQWPEAITQQTLQEFLEEVNYFNEPKKFVNIGLSINRDIEKKPKSNTDLQKSSISSTNVSQVQVDELLDQLGQEAELPPLNYDDTLVSPDQLANIALNHGIYRDLFDRRSITNENISFTPEQAERLNLLIPHYWITDLPRSRVKRDRKDPNLLYYFEPVINISARFVNNDKVGGNFAHIPYYGNIIPASEALQKPSITLDGRWLSDDPYSDSLVKPDQFDNWTSGNISFNNFGTDQDKHFYSILMLNLDTIHEDAANLHWFVANLSMLDKNTDGTLKFEEICEYLPVYGIRGFGHSRYALLIVRHDKRIDSKQYDIQGFSLESRRFNAKALLDDHKDKNMVPVGVSWFQTIWDESSNQVFHDFLKMKAPVYDTVQPELEKQDLAKKPYPGRVPFNIFLDQCRARKDINEQVLLERLKTVDPFDYKDQYEPPKVPPTVFEDGKVPSWMNNVLKKKKNRVGYWRGLRPSSATIPLNNNADLDSPMWPIPSVKKTLPGYHNVYQGKPILKKIKDMECYTKPPNEHQNVFIVDDHEIHLDKAREVMEKSVVKKNATKVVKKDANQG